MTASAQTTPWVETEPQVQVPQSPPVMGRFSLVTGRAYFSSTHADRAGPIGLVAA